MTPDSMAQTSIAAYLELGAKRVFSCALDWPGWCRSGRDEDQASATLAAYAERYAPVAVEAGIPFPLSPLPHIEVLERLPGSATTDFGAPGEIPNRDWEPLTHDAAERLAVLVRASWAVFDRAVAGAPAVLRKGPRGGGRDRDAVVEHVLAAETAYARKLGVRHRQAELSQAPALLAFRAAIVDALRAEHIGAPVAGKGWPVPYAARRIAWHVLDHTWEIEDRSSPAP